MEIATHGQWLPYWIARSRLQLSTPSKLASKPPPHPSRRLPDGDSLAQVPPALCYQLTSHFNPCLWSPGFWWHSLCPSRQLLLLSCPLASLCQLLCSGFLLHLAPQTRPRTLRIFTLTWIAINIPGPGPDALEGQQRGRMFKTDVTKKSQDVWLFPYEKYTEEKWRCPLQGAYAVSGETGYTENTKKPYSSSRANVLPGLGEKSRILGWVPQRSSQEKVRALPVQAPASSLLLWPVRAAGKKDIMSSTCKLGLAKLSSRRG